MYAGPRQHQRGRRGPPPVEIHTVLSHTRPAGDDADTVAKYVGPAARVVPRQPVVARHLGEGTSHRKTGHRPLPRVVPHLARSLHSADGPPVCPTVNRFILVPIDSVA